MLAKENAAQSSADMMIGCYCYIIQIMSNKIASGVAHKLPSDLRKTLTVNKKVLAAWEDITPIARNEFICWVEHAKKAETRNRRIRRTAEELLEGKRRPCCWAGCSHR